MTRRGVVGAGVGVALVQASCASSLETSAADSVTAPIDTSFGKVRGVRRRGISRFLGIRYGADTAPVRFQAPRAPQAWGGVQDCFAYGAQAPQGVIRVSQAQPANASAAMSAMTPGSVAAAVMQIAAASQGSGTESEDCLFLNVYTPDASRARRRPVMVWLHGGGLSVGSGGIPSTDGDELALHGDVVIVSLNHRLNALGYLYLGALHSDFADSGNVGQLDIVLALQWVRDNIENFGGDPGNVTIFGQSGGGWKVGTLLAMPPARGLFHKAIEMSGPAVRAVERADGAALAERTLAALGVVAGDVHRLQSLDARAVIAAQANAETGNALSGRRELGPTIDGRNLLGHPFDPVATEVSRDIPLMIGAAKDENTMFMAFDPAFGRMSADDVRQRFDAVAGPRAAEAFELYRSRAPNDAPTYWLTSYLTDQSFWAGSMMIAERKAAQSAAPVFLYRVDWDTVLAGGALRATHGTDMPFVFRHLDGFGAMDGDGPEQRDLMEKMSTAWTNFARTGDPSQRTLRWPRYEQGTRMTMIFDAETRAVSDPDAALRVYWDDAL